MPVTKDRIESLVEYCSANGIEISSSIEPRYTPGLGLGIYARKDIAENEQLLHVPTRQIFTTANIPEAFLSTPAREGLPVHALLAAFFAFGSEEDLEVWKPWMQTWPALEDFHETMPMFWSDALTKELHRNISPTEKGLPSSQLTRPVAKRRKRHGNARGPKGSSKDASDVQTTVEADTWFSELRTLRTIHGQVNQMIDKLVSHTVQISNALPHLELGVSTKQLVKYLHAWCLINTRCFYYIPAVPPRSKTKKTKPKAPADPNEAMGLCPFMDLFNHIALDASVSTTADSQIQKSCKVKCNAMGFTTRTASEIARGREVLLSYGAHSNDTLWSEYGFLLPGSNNTSDCISLDATILGDLSAKECGALEDQGYFGSYSLFNDGSVCYRTEMAAWLRLLGPHRWTSALEEDLDPSDVVADPLDVAAVEQSSHDRSSLVQDTADPKQEHAMIIKCWLKLIHHQADTDGTHLRLMERPEIVQRYQTLSIISEIYSHAEEEKADLAVRRHKMCMDRCKQIYDMAARGLEKL